MSASSCRLAVVAALAVAAFAPPLLAAQPSANRYIVKFQPGQDGPGRAALTRAAARVALELPSVGAVAVELPNAGALAALQRNPNIEYVERDVPRYTMSLATESGAPYATGQLVPYGIFRVQADQLTGVNANTRKVCIIDSGYDRGHEDLPSDSKVTGRFNSGTQWWYTDENSHGTHVAGTIAALNNANTGVVGVVSNGSLNLHIVKVFGKDGWAYSSSLAAAAQECADVEANIISMSLGGSFSSRTEKQTFDRLYAAGILSIAAAGNDGSKRQSYPASYDSVMSVAALNPDNTWASFSQSNKQVEIAAPGVSVLSTVPMGTGRDAATTVNGVGYASLAMDGSPVATGSGALVDCGLGTSACAAAGGKVCLIERGSITFAEKVLNCQAGGGSAAIIYNNVDGALNGTLGDTVTTIPSVGVTRADGLDMKAPQGAAASVAVTATHYAYFDGTSMATPHVSAAAALAWSARTGCTAAQVRKALTATALDLDKKGRDPNTGWGLVQAGAARAYLSAGCQGG